MKKSNQDNQPNQDELRQDRTAEYYANLARISGTLIAGLLALLTFLLVVGIQNQVKGFSGLLYASFIVLGLSLIVYVFGNMVTDLRRFLLGKSADGRKSLKQQKRITITNKSLAAIRILHQVIFIGSVAVVVLFAISYSQLVLYPKPVQQPVPATQGNAPEPNGSGQAPAQGETSE